MDSEHGAKAYGLSAQRQVGESPRQSMVEQVVSTAESLDALLGRVTDLSNRVCGSVPREASGTFTGKDRPPMGVAEIIGEATTRSRVNVNRIYDEIARIEAVL